MKDEYGLEIPPNNLPLSLSLYKLLRTIMEGKKIVDEKYRYAARVNYYKLKATLALNGIVENPFYTGEESSSISKYIYEEI